MSETGEQGELFPRRPRGERVAKPKPKREQSLGEVLMRKLTGRAPGAVERERKKSLPERVKWLEKKHKGDEKAAADAAGLSLTTWRRWRSGKQKPSAKSVEKLDRATREALVPKGRRNRIERSTKGGQSFDHRPTGGAVLSAWITISSDSRPRDINLGANLPEGRLNAIVKAFTEGGEAEAEKELKAAIREYLGGGASTPYEDRKSVV